MKKTFAHCGYPAVVRRSTSALTLTVPQMQAVFEGFRLLKKREHPDDGDGAGYTELEQYIKMCCSEHVQHINIAHVYVKHMSKYLFFVNLSTPYGNEYEEKGCMEVGQVLNEIREVYEEAYIRNT